MHKMKIPQILTLIRYWTLIRKTNELRGVEKKSGESISTFSASVPRPAFEIIKAREMWVKRKMQKNITITLCFNRLQSN